jgi:hypothetical protein
MADKVFVNGRAVVHKGSLGQSVAFPDVCLCPPTPPAGPIPTPLPNAVKAADLDGGAASVRIEGNPAGTRSAHFRLSTGNEVARPTGGGVISLGVQGKAYFQTFSVNVLFEGEPVVRHLDLLTHNHLGPAPGNTPPTPWLSAMAPPPPTGIPPRKKQPRDKKPETRDWKLWVELDPSDPKAEDDELVLVDAAGTEVRRVRLSAMAAEGAGKVVVFENIDLNARFSLIREYGPDSGGTVALFVDFTPNELDDFSEDVEDGS